MANIPAENAHFALTDSGATSRNLSTDVVSIEGLPGPRTLLDNTPLGATGRTYHPGLQDVKFTVEFLYNDTADTGSAIVIKNLRAHTAATAFIFGPKGSTTGFEKWSGTCWVSNPGIGIRIGSLVSITVEFTVKGALTAGVF